MSLQVTSKDEAVKKLGVLEGRWRYPTYTTRAEYSERDTITKFVIPLIATLGWDVYNINEVKEEVYLEGLTEGKTGFLDILVCLNGKPHIAIEVKALQYGKNMREDIEAITELLQKAKKLDTKYAVLTQFGKTIVYDTSTGKEIAFFEIFDRNGYIDDLEKLWLLSKEGSSTEADLPRR